MLRMAGVVPKKLNELQQNTKNAIVTALVITKTDPKYFFVKKSKEFHGVITFTLRDSKTSVCNCKFWSSKERVEKSNLTMKIGDIIDVVCPIVVSNKFCTDHNQRFLPISTLPITLIVNDGGSSLSLNDYQNVELLNRLQELLFIPHRPLCDTLRLSDVRFSYAAAAAAVGQKGEGGAKKSKMPSQSVDLLVMVAQIREAKQIQLPNEKTAQCLDIVVFDESIPDGMLLSLWQIVWIQRAQQYWQPMKTVLHLIDVNIVDSSYHKCCILHKSAQTVIYENPFGKVVDSLREFALKMPQQNFQMIGQSRHMEKLPNPDEIRTQMTVKQIYLRLEGNIKDDSDEFTAVLYGMITQFDVDGYQPIIGRICKSCQRILGLYNTVCDSDKCRFAFTTQARTDDCYDYFYKVSIHLADHTGSLVETRLTDALAAEIFKTSAANFEKQFKHNKKDLQSLKWCYLFQRFEVKLCVKKVTTTQHRPSILVVAMQPTKDVDAIANNIMVC